MKYLIFFALVLAQSMSFTFISRARNRNNVKLAAIASFFSNTTWILVFRHIVLHLEDWVMYPLYVGAMVLGCVTQMKISRKFFEKMDLR